MTDHKFEPFEKVLVRNRNYHPWEPMHYGYAKDGEHVCAGNPYQQCIPYTPDTAHLLGTSRPYEPPKPPVEHAWGQKVEVCAFIGEWEMALYIGRAKNNDILAILEDDEIIRQFSEDKVRPLSDDTAAH